MGPIININFGKKVATIYVKEETSTRCEVTDNPLRLVIELDYIPNEGRILELTYFRKLINDLAKKPTTVEEYANVLFDVVYNVLRPVAMVLRVTGSSPDQGEVTISLASETLEIEGDVA